MTALDDALNSSSIVWGEHQLYVNWREVDNGDIASNPDSVSNLSSQFNGAATISHSLDDGLPDPVTMTSGAEASGSLAAGLNGRQGLTLASSGQRAFTSTALAGGFFAGGGATLTGPTANNVQRGDYLVTAVLTDSVTNVPVQSSLVDPKDAWTFLGSTVSAGNVLQVYGARYYPGHPALMLQSAGSFNYAIMGMAFWGLNPSGIPLTYRPTKFSSFSETTSRTTHPISNTVDAGKAYQIGIWGSGSSVGPWAAVAGGTEWGEQVGSGLDLMMAVGPLTDNSVNTLTATTTTATASAVIAAVTLAPYERPYMDGRQYFSPFNANSPLYRFDRDTAGAQFTFNVITATGPVGTVLYTGVMSDLPISGRTAELDAVSAARIAMNTSFTLPVVYGYREGCTIDWLAAYLMARGGRYVGQAPTRYMRYWAPLYGSMHAFSAGQHSYNYGLSRTGASWLGYKNMASVAGQWLSGMYAEQTATRTLETFQNISTDPITSIVNTDFPQLVGGLSPVTADTWSYINSRGRISFWIRGDTVTAAPSYLTDANDQFYASFTSSMQDSAGNFLGFIRIQIRSSDGLATVWMGSTVAGFSLYSYPSLGAIGAGWNFYSFQWDFAAGQVNMKHNATEIQTTTFATDGRNVNAQLAPTDLQGVAAGYNYTTTMRAHVPLSDFMYEVPDSGWSSWAGVYLTPASPGASVITRPTLQWIQAIANPSPVVAWDTLAELAQSALAMYRANEDDNMEFLPLGYFGETAQMTPSSIADVSKNAQDLDVTLDPSKSRNVVTVQFPETSVTTNISPILTVSQSLTLPRGSTLVTFTLDSLTAEIHGASAPKNSWWTLTSLTASQITTPNVPIGVHYATFNTAADGSGTVLTYPTAYAKILYGDAATITLQFINNSGGIAYLANNGQEVPFLQLLGYAVSSNDGYVTARDSGSIGIRRERGLTSELDWIQDRATAGDISTKLAAMLSRPRAQLDVTVMGDPRRRPGQMVTVADGEGTQAAGTWRILAVKHNLAGAQYTQDLSLVFVGPILNWDDPTTTWDYSVWGA